MDALATTIFSQVNIELPPLTKNKSPDTENSHPRYSGIGREYEQSGGRPGSSLHHSRRCWGKEDCQAHRTSGAKERRAVLGGGVRVGWEEPGQEALGVEPCATALVLTGFSGRGCR